MNSILDYSFKDLKQLMVENRVAANRAYQIYGWVYRKMVFDFDAMSDLPKDFRAEMKAGWSVLDLKVLDSLASPGGETVKFLMETGDGCRIESVIILDDDEDSGENAGDETGQKRVTLCVSSQAGCALGCSFCATGILGLKRDLKPPEILSQVLIAERYIKDSLPAYAGKNGQRSIGNIVFMGMGEPLLNYDNVMKAVHILNFSGGYNLGARHFTLSTAGIIEGINRLAEEKLQVRLAVSLHTADENTRKKIMPVARSNFLGPLMDSIRKYQEKTERRVTFEYILMEGINDSEDDVISLKRMLYDMRYNLNVIVYNPVPSLPFSRPSEHAVRQWVQYLKKHGIPYVFRKSKGSDINAGCGQLGLLWKNAQASNTDD